MRQLPRALWYTRTPNPTPLGLASQLGWFLDEFRDDGIDVFTLDEEGDAARRAALQPDRHLTHSIRQGGNVPALWARARGAATRVIGLNWLDEFQGILSLPGSGVESIADLRGRRVGLPVYAHHIESRRADALHGFVAALELDGLASSQVEFVDVAERPLQRAGADGRYAPFGEYTQVIHALLAGEVDAVYVKGDRGLRAAHLAHAQVVFDFATHPDPLVRVHNGSPRPITVHQSLLDEHPELVVRFLSRVVDIGAWAERHPDETLAYVARETHASSDWVRRAYGDDLHRHQHTGLDEIAIRALDVQKAFLLKWGFIRHDFDVRAWIAPEPLAEVLGRQGVSSVV